MNKNFLKKNIVAIVTGIVVWLLLAAFLNKLIVAVTSQDLRFNIYYLWGYGLVVSFIAAIVVGWRGAARGFFLGLINQLFISLGFQFMNLLSANPSVSLKGLLIQLPWFLIAGIGGIIGEKLRGDKSFLSLRHKRDIWIIICGLLIWSVLSFISNILNDYFIKAGYHKSFPYFLLTCLTIASFLSAFFVGSFGKGKGWFLGMIMQGIITSTLLLFPLFSETVHGFTSENDISFTYSLFKYVVMQIPWFISAMLGGHLGEKKRRIN